MVLKFRMQELRSFYTFGGKPLGDFANNRWFLIEFACELPFLRLIRPRKIRIFTGRGYPLIPGMGRILSFVHGLYVIPGLRLIVLYYWLKRLTCFILILQVKN